MTFLIIREIKTFTRDGLDVVVIGLDPSSHDCIVGRMLKSGENEVRWDLSGRMRDGDESANLDMNSDDLIDLESLARHLSRSNTNEGQTS